MHKMSYKRMLKAYITSIQHSFPNDAAVLPFESTADLHHTHSDQTPHKHLKISMQVIAKTFPFFISQ